MYSVTRRNLQAGRAIMSSRRGALGSALGFSMVVALMRPTASALVASVVMVAIFLPALEI
jgi:hypothetical protein